MNRICNLADAAEMMRGMKRRSSEAAGAKWRRIIGEQRESGLSVAAFCRRQGVPASSCFLWKRRLAAEPAPAFVEVTAGAPADEARPADDTPLEVLLASDRLIIIRPGFDAEALREVVRVLEGLS